MLRAERDVLCSSRVQPQMTHLCHLACANFVRFAVMGSREPVPQCLDLPPPNRFGCLSHILGDQLAKRVPQCDQQELLGDRSKGSFNMVVNRF